MLGVDQHFSKRNAITRPNVVDRVVSLLASRHLSLSPILPLRLLSGLGYPCMSSFVHKVERERGTKNPDSENSTRVKANSCMVDVPRRSICLMRQFDGGSGQTLYVVAVHLSS